MADDGIVSARTIRRRKQRQREAEAKNAVAVQNSAVPTKFVVKPDGTIEWPALKPFIQKGDVVPLAVLNTRRIGAFESVPTAAEGGISDLVELDDSKATKSSSDIAAEAARYTVLLECLG